MYAHACDTKDNIFLTDFNKYNNIMADGEYNCAYVVYYSRSAAALIYSVTHRKSLSAESVQDETERSFFRI